MRQLEVHTLLYSTQVLRLLEGLLLPESVEHLESVAAGAVTRRASQHSSGGLSDEGAAGGGGAGPASETASVVSDAFGFYSGSGQPQDDAASDTNSVLLLDRLLLSFCTSKNT